MKSVAGMGPGATLFQETACPAGKVAIGGAWQVSQPPVGTKNLTVIQDNVVRDGAGAPRAWRVTVRNDGSPMLGSDFILSFDLEVSAICVAMP